MGNETYTDGYDDSLATITKIIELKNDFIVENGKNPNRIFVTVGDYAGLLEELGGLDTMPEKAKKGTALLSLIQCEVYITTKGDSYVEYSTEPVHADDKEANNPWNIKWEV